MKNICIILFVVFLISSYSNTAVAQWRWDSFASPVEEFQANRKEYKVEFNRNFGIKPGTNKEAIVLYLKIQRSGKNIEHITIPLTFKTVRSEKVNNFQGRDFFEDPKTIRKLDLSKKQIAKITKEKREFYSDLHKSARELIVRRRGNLTKSDIKNWIPDIKKAERRLRTNCYSVLDQPQVAKLRQIRVEIDRPFGFITMLIGEGDDTNSGFIEDLGITKDQVTELKKRRKEIQGTVSNLEKQLKNEIQKIQIESIPKLKKILNEKQNKKLNKLTKIKN